MREHHRPRILHRAGLLLAGILGLAVIYSCSLIVETRDQQCQIDADCNGFTNAHCDKSKGICVGGTGGGGGGTTSSTTTSTTTTSTATSSTSTGGGCDVNGGIDAGGCYNCKPTDTDDSQFLNHCTGSMCIPFDNKTRIDALADGGTLPPLPKDGGP